MPIILAIESSCDDTSAAICKDGKILANIATAQIVHASWGGIVPELASREHLKQIVAVVDSAFRKAGITKQDIDAVAFTKGPGLIGSLMVGVSFAKALALALQKPLIDVHHMEAHVLANFIDQEPVFPHLCLTVSGGHTQIVLVKSPLDLQVIGQTLDDAAGEAFDKIGKLLGLPYPAGHLIDKYAKEGNPNAFSFSIAASDDLQFSFSGLKTSVMYFLQKQTRLDADFITNNLADIAASVQHTIVSTLIQKLERACLEMDIKAISLAGGVSANSGLRTAFQALADKHTWQAYIPAFEYCTDNAGMIAIAAHYKFLAGQFCSQDVEPMARIPMRLLGE